MTRAPVRYPIIWLIKAIPTAAATRGHRCRLHGGCERSRAVCGGARVSRAASSGLVHGSRGLRLLLRGVGEHHPLVGGGQGGSGR